MQKTLLSLLLSVCAIGTAQANPQYLQVLDPVYYMNMNPDIKRYAGGDIEKAKQHWLQHGVNEGRESAPWFSTKGYCQRQEPGFQAHFANCTNYRGLVDHFLGHGRAEGRATFPIGKDSHLLQIFDVQFYIDNYPDIKQHFSNNHAGAQNHWLQHGINEARQGSYGFSLEAYMGHNADLLNVYGSNKNYNELALHFNHHGRKEGRNFTPTLRTDLSGQLIIAHGDPRAFVVDSTGRKRHIASPQAASNCGLNLGQIRHIPKGELFVIASASIVHGNNDCPQSGGGTASVSGTIDPIAEMLKVKPAAGALLNSLRGMITLNNASGVNLEKNEVFAVEGQFNTKSVSGNHLVATMMRTAGLASTRLFGLPETVKMKAALAFANAEWDLSLAINIVDTFKMTPALVPTVEPKLAFKDADFVLHAKMSTGAPSVSTELTGSAFFKPTVRDPWLALTPTAEIDNEGTLTVGGTLAGVCPGNINAGTQFGSCTSIWNVLSLNVLEAQGGVLKLTLDPKVANITGIETAIQNGRFNKTLIVDGALLTDADASPGFGLALKARTGDPLKFLKAMPFSNQAPFSTAINAIPGGMNASADRTIIIAPTAMSVGHINYPRPTFEFGTSFQGSGMSASVNGKLEGNISIITSGQSIQARPDVNSAFNLAVNPGNIQGDVKSALKSIPGMNIFSDKVASLFKLKNLYVTGHRKADGHYEAKGYLEAQVLGPAYKAEVPVQGMLNRPSVAGFAGKATADNFHVWGQHIAPSIMDYKTGIRLAEEISKSLASGAPDFGTAVGTASNVLKAAGVPVPTELTDAASGMTDAMKNAGSTVGNAANEAGNAVKKAACLGIFC